MRRSRLLLGLVVGATACSEPSSPAGLVLLQAERPTYRPSASVALTIRNLSSDQVQVSSCFPRLEQLTADSVWITIHENADPCPAVLELLDGYASREARVALPGNVSAGTYRVRFPVIGPVPDEGETFVVAAQVGGDFEVRP